MPAVTAVPPSLTDLPGRNSWKPTSAPPCAGATSAIQAHKPTTASTTHMEGHAHRDILEHHRTRDHRLTDRHNTQLGVFRQTKERERETPSEKPPALFVTTGLPTVLKPPRVREWVGLQHNLMQLPVNIEVVRFERLFRVASAQVNETYKAGGHGASSPAYERVDRGLDTGDPWRSCSRNWI